MNPDFFYFKQFKLRNRDSGFKVNTDGVLLGAWANIGVATTILDIGTGTGVIPLMLAQKCHSAKITAVEIQEDSYEEALFNFLLNNKTIELHHCSIQTFAESNKTYDHIVCNPPYFHNDTKAQDSKLNISKHNHSLNFKILWQVIQKLSHPKTKVSIIIPFISLDEINHLAKASEYYPSRMCLIKSRPHLDWKRVLLEYEKEESNPIEHDEMYLQDEGRNNWSDRYRELTKDFYLSS